MPAKCALGCRTNVYPMRIFPNPEKDPERFRSWMEVLGDDAPRSLTDEQIFKRLRVCDRHFIYEHRARFKRLTAMAVPYRILPGQSIVETEPNAVEETNSTQTDNNEEEELVEVYQICDDSDYQVAEEVCVRPDDEDITSPVSTENTDENPRNKVLIEDGLVTLNTPIVIDGTDEISEVPCTSSCKDDSMETTNKLTCLKYSPNMVEYYRRRYIQAQKKLITQNNQLDRMRRKTTQDISKNQAMKIVTKNMNEPTKLFLSMQMKNSNSNFTMEEKTLSLSIYKKSPECYELLADYFVLPSSEIMRNMDSEFELCTYTIDTIDISDDTN